MSTALQFGFLGLAAGAVYGLLAQGVVTIFKGSGVLNFAQGAVALAAALTFDELTKSGSSNLVAFVLSLLVSGALGTIISLGIMRPLREAPALAKNVATLGIFLVIGAACLLIFGSSSRFVNPILPSASIELFGVTFGRDRLYLTGIAVLITAALWALYRFTKFGLATRATAESEFSASLRGVSPTTIGWANWTLGSILAGAAGILIAPTAGIDLQSFPLLVVPAFAAALIGGFTSFPLAMGAGLALGVMEAELLHYWTQPGAQSALPFAVILIVLLFRSKAIPDRDFLVRGRLPKAPDAPFRFWLPVVLLPLLLIGLALLPSDYQYAFQTSCIIAVVALSQVLITGFAGQISLAQMTFAGIGALLAARMGTDLHIPFPLPVLLAAIVAFPIGFAFGLPSVRVRGVSLAVVTLGLAVAVSAFVFGNGDWTGLPGASKVPEPHLWGWSLDAVNQPGSFGLIAILFLLLCSGLVAWIRRSKLGRRLLAVRENERAAAASGIDVRATKLIAFALSSSLAAAGGALLAYQAAQVSYESFSPTISITLLATVYIGGIAAISGAWMAGVIVSGGLFTLLLSQALSSVDEYIAVGSGVLLILTVIMNPDGVVPYVKDMFAAARNRGSTSAAATTPTVAAPAPAVGAAVSEPVGKNGK